MVQGFEASVEAKNVGKQFRAVLVSWAWQDFGVAGKNYFRGAETHYYRQGARVPFPRFVYGLGACVRGRTSDAALRRFGLQDLDAVVGCLNTSFDVSRFPVFWDTEVTGFVVNLAALGDGAVRVVEVERASGSKRVKRSVPQTLVLPAREGFVPVQGKPSRPVPKFLAKGRGL